MDLFAAVSLFQGIFGGTTPPTEKQETFCLQGFLQELLPGKVLRGQKCFWHARVLTDFSARRRGNCVKAALLWFRVHFLDGPSSTGPLESCSGNRIIWWMVFYQHGQHTGSSAAQIPPALRSRSAAPSSRVHVFAFTRSAPFELQILRSATDCDQSVPTSVVKRVINHK